MTHNEDEFGVRIVEELSELMDSLLVIGEKKGIEKQRTKEIISIVIKECLGIAYQDKPLGE